MEPEQKPIDPTLFQPVSDRPAVEPSSPPQTETKAPGWITAGVIVLGIIAVFVFVWLPSLIEPPEAPKPSLSEMASARASQPAQSASSPWEEAQRSRERQTAQEALQEFLDRQFELEELAVERWQSSAFNGAVEQAKLGDQLYREQRFAEASEAYRAGAATLQQVIDNVPQVIIEQLAQGNQALEQTDSVLAQQAFETVLAIEPDNREALSGLQRAKALDQVVQLYQQGQRAQTNGDFSAALALYEEASTLDPDNPLTPEPLQQVRAELKQQRYLEAMSDGYSALSSNRFGEAKQHFNRAKTLDPSNPEVGEALLLVESRGTLSRIDRLTSQAEQAAEAERWSEAVDRYHQVVKLDPALEGLAESLKNAQQRASLDQKLEQILSTPKMLQDESTYRSSVKLYRAAEGLSNPGPRLSRQLSAVKETLLLSRRAIPVTLNSDGLTQVTLLKVGKLGSFEQQQLELIPGDYTAVGIRNGYRDVRLSFSVDHSQSMPSITVACREKI